MTRIMLRSIFRSSRAQTPPRPPSVPPSELEQHNRLILETSDISHVTLPSMFVLWRHQSPERSIRVNGLTHEQAFCAVCIVTERVGGAVHPLWRLTLVEQPLEALGSCSVAFHPDHWLSGQTHKIIVQRPSPEPERNNKLYISELSHSRYALRLESGQSIPILKMSQPCLTLHSRFSHVDTIHMETFGFVCDHGRDLIPPTLVRREEIRREALQIAQRAARTLLEFAQSDISETERTPRQASRPTPRPPMIPPPAVQVRLAPPPPPPHTSSRPTMPQHIVNTVIESLVAQGQECPIEQTALTKETACLTPCGHAMTLDAAARWIRGAHSCPECRSPCLVDQLQAWRAS